MLPDLTPIGLTPHENKRFIVVRSAGSSGCVHRRYPESAEPSDQVVERAMVPAVPGVRAMVSLRFPLIARRMVFEVRLEQPCGQDSTARIPSSEGLEALHQATIAGRELRRTQLAWDREKIYSGSMMLR
jgi:hypothetical protein